MFELMRRIRLCTGTEENSSTRSTADDEQDRTAGQVNADARSEKKRRQAKEMRSREQQKRQCESKHKNKKNAHALTSSKHTEANG